MLKTKNPNIDKESKGIKNELESTNVSITPKIPHNSPRTKTSLTHVYTKTQEKSSHTCAGKKTGQRRRRRRGRDSAE
jgi:hypothetical protein